MLNHQALHAAINDEAHTLEVVKPSGETLALRIPPRRRRYRAAQAVAAVKAEEPVELVRVLSKDGAVIATLRDEEPGEPAEEGGQVMLDPYARAVEVVDAIYQRAYAAARESFTASLSGSSKAVEVMSVALTRSHEVMVIAQERQREAQDAQIEAVKTAAASTGDPNILEFIKELPAMMPMFLQVKALMAGSASKTAPPPAPPPAG